MARRHLTVVASALALFALAGCGGGDDDPPAATDAATPDTDDASGASGTSDTFADTPATTDAPAQAPSGGGLGMGAETWAKQLRVALRADDYTVDGNTVTLTLGSGTSADGESACGVAAATSGTNVEVVLTYPDGDVTC